jgi:hypothetical protein
LFPITSPPAPLTLLMRLGWTASFPVSKEKIAVVLGLEVQTIRERVRLLDGICPDALRFCRTLFVRPRSSTS